MSLIIGALNLLPLRSGDQLADGRRIFSLLTRHGESGLILASTLMLVEALSSRRPRDWDPALLAVMERSPDEVFARLCLYEAAIDRGEIEAAGRHIDAAVALRSAKWTSVDAILFTEAAYYVARHRGDARSARALLGLADGGGVVDFLRARAEAAVLCAEGRGLEGRQRAVAGLAALERARRKDGDPCREQLEELARGAGALVRPILTRSRQRSRPPAHTATIARSRPGSGSSPAPRTSRPRCGGAAAGPPASSEWRPYRPSSSRRSASQSPAFSCSPSRESPAHHSVSRSSLW